MPRSIRATRPQGTVKGEEVILEKLDAVETCRGDRSEFSTKSPLIETVAIEVVIGLAPCLTGA